MSINVTIHGNPVKINREKMVALDCDGEFETRRKIRLQQVRQQAKEIAEDVRNRVRREKYRQIHKIEKDEEKKLQRQNERKLAMLQKQKEKCMEEFGDAYRDANKQLDPDLAINKIREHVRHKAEIRGKIATQEYKLKKDKEMKEARKSIEDKRQARAIENLRAKLVSNIPLCDNFITTKKTRKSLTIDGTRNTKTSPPPDDSYTDTGDSDAVDYQSDFGNLSVLGEIDMRTQLDSEGNSIQSDESTNSPKQNDTVFKYKKNVFEEIQSSNKVSNSSPKNGKLSSRKFSPNVLGMERAAPAIKPPDSRPVTFNSHENYQNGLTDNAEHVHIGDSPITVSEFAKTKESERVGKFYTETCLEDDDEQAAMNLAVEELIGYQSYTNPILDSEQKDVNPRNFVQSRQTTTKKRNKMKQHSKNIKQRDETEHLRQKLIKEQNKRRQSPLNKSPITVRTYADKCEKINYPEVPLKLIIESQKKGSKVKNGSPKKKSNKLKKDDVFRKPMKMYRKTIRSKDVEALKMMKESSESAPLIMDDNFPREVRSPSRPREESRWGTVCPCPVPTCPCDRKSIYTHAPTKFIQQETDDDAQTALRYDYLNRFSTKEPQKRVDQLASDETNDPRIVKHYDHVNRYRAQEDDNILPYVPTTIVRPETDETHDAYVRYYDHFNHFGANQVKPAVIQKISTDSIQVLPPSDDELKLAELHKRRDEEARIRGNKALEKNKIHKKYQKLLEELPILQRQERLASMATHDPVLHMDNQRYQEFERKKQNRMENEFENYDNKLNTYDIPLITLKSVRKSPPKGGKGPSRAVGETENISLNVGQWKNVESSDSSPQQSLENSEETLEVMDVVCNKTEEEELAELLKRVNKQREILLKEAVNLPSLSNLKKILNEQEILSLLGMSTQEQTKLLVETGTSPILTKSVQTSQVEFKSEILLKHSAPKKSPKQVETVTGSSDTSGKTTVRRHKKGKASKKMKTSKETETQTTPTVSKTVVPRTTTENQKEEGTQTNPLQAESEISSSDQDKLCEIIIKAIQDANVNAQKKKVPEKILNKITDATVKMKNHHQQTDSRGGTADMSTSTSYFSPPVDVKKPEEKLPCELATCPRLKQLRSSNKDLLQPQKQQTNLNDLVKVENGKKVINPRLLKYIKRLLDMSRKNIDDLTVSSVSDVSTPHDSVVHITSNMAKEKLQNVMDHFSLTVDDIKKYYISTSSFSTSDISTESVQKNIEEILEEATHFGESTVSVENHGIDIQTTKTSDQLLSKRSRSPKRTSHVVQRSRSTEKRHVAWNKTESSTGKEVSTSDPDAQNMKPRSVSPKLYSSNSTSGENGKGFKERGTSPNTSRVSTTVFIEKEIFTHQTQATSTDRLNSTSTEFRPITIGSPTKDSTKEPKKGEKVVELPENKEHVKRSSPKRKSPSKITPAADSVKSASPTFLYRPITQKPVTPRSPQSGSPKAVSPRQTSTKKDVCPCPPSRPCASPKTFVSAVNKATSPSDEPDLSKQGLLDENKFLQFVRECLDMTEKEFNELGFREMFAKHINLTEYCQDRIKSLMDLIQKVRDDKKLIYSPSPVDNSTLTSYLELPQSKADDSHDRSAKQEKTLEPLAEDDLSGESGSSISQGTMDDYLLNIDTATVALQTDRPTHREQEVSKVSGINTNKGPSDTFVPMLQGIPKYREVESTQEYVQYSKNVKEIYQRMKPRPPPSLLRSNMRGQTDAIPHELSTIAEAETGASSRNTSGIRAHSPEELKPNRDVSPGRYESNKNSPKLETTFMSPCHSESSDYITITPEILYSESESSGTVSKSSKNIKVINGSSPRNEYKTKLNVESGLKLLSDSSADSQDELESMLRKFNLEWAISLVKKTEQALALSSGSSSSDVQVINRGNSSDASLKDTCRELFKRLKDSSGSDIDNNLFSDLSQHFKEFQDISEILGVPECRSKSQQRTSTPVHFSKSTDSKNSNSSKESLFRIDSDISSVRNSSDNVNDNLFLSVPNVSLNTTRWSLKKCKKKS